MENVIGWLTLKTKIDTSGFKKKIDEIKNEGGKKLKDFLKNLGSVIKEFAAGLKEVINTLLFSGLMLGVLGAIALLAKGVKDVLKETKSKDVEQIKAQIEYISNALKGAILPVVQAVASVIKRILDYVIYIGEAWFGLSKYASNYKNEVKKANKETGKLRKELAKFDDVNVLNSDKGSGASGLDIPEYKGMEGEPPAWLKWIADNKNLILSVMEGVALGLVAWKLGLDKINPIGIGLAIVGIYKAVKALLDYINDPSWENLGNLIIWIGVAIAGFGLAIGSLPVVVSGAIVVILGLLVKFWNKIEEFLDGIIEILDNFGNEALDWLTEHFGLVGALLGAFVLIITDTLKQIINVIKDVFGGILRFVKAFIDGIIQMFKGDLWGGLTTILKGIANLFIDTFNLLIDLLNIITAPVRSLIVALGKVAGKSWTMETIQIPKVKRLATGGIVDIPKSGARLGNAIVGEAGAEGVLPLTDEATMTRLGQEIAKWIPINLNITNELDGRILSNRLETIRQNNSFSRNGG